MEFFNTKEEVIDIKLTQMGRVKLARGKLKPVYYAFFDRGVIYDAKYGGVEENQNDISGRIKISPRTKLQATRVGIETMFLKRKEFIESQDEDKQGTWQPPADLSIRNYGQLGKNEDTTLGREFERLGTSALNSSYYPAVDVHFEEGEISSSFNNYTGSLGGNINPAPIPQLNCNVEFNTYIGLDGVSFDNNEEPASTDFGPEVIEPGLSSDPEDDRLYSPDTYADGSYVGIKTKKLLFNIIEKHVPLSKEDFDLEVFQVINTKNETTGFERERLKQLKFIKDDDNLINYENTIYNKSTKKTYQVTSDYVEYYFEVTVDKEIEKDITGAATTPVVLPTNPEEPCADE
tara:strand:+ start:2225 stop:3265 length:1041 start_codon:yes stop_codon:yes gene_type:complete